MAFSWLGMLFLSVCTCQKFNSPQTNNFCVFLLWDCLLFWVPALARYLHFKEGPCLAPHILHHGHCTHRCLHMLVKLAVTPSSCVRFGLSICIAWKNPHDDKLHEFKGSWSSLIPFTFTSKWKLLFWPQGKAILPFLGVMSTLSPYKLLLGPTCFFRQNVP